MESMNRILEWSPFALQMQAMQHIVRQHNVASLYVAHTPQKNTTARILCETSVKRDVCLLGSNFVTKSTVLINNTYISFKVPISVKTNSITFTTLPN